MNKCFRTLKKITACTGIRPFRKLRDQYKGSFSLRLDFRLSVFVMVMSFFLSFLAIFEHDGSFDLVFSLICSYVIKLVCSYVVESN